jgi:hypothetical protein
MTHEDEGAAKFATSTAEVLRADRNLDQVLCRTPSPVASLHALFLMQMSEKHTPGIERQNGLLEREGVQTVVSFDAHRLLDVQADAETHRRALTRRAYDHILELTLAQMCQRRSKRQEQRVLILDHRHVLRPQMTGTGRAMHLLLIHDSRNTTAAALPLRIQTSALPKRQDFFKQMDRYLR